MTRVMQPRRRGRSQRGFTLIELMVSLVLFSFAVAGVLSVAVSLANGLREQRLAVETESAARGAMDFLGDALRGASPGVSTGNIQHTTLQCTTTGTPPKAFMVVNSSTGPDELYVTYASGSVVTATATVLATTGTSVTVDDASQIQNGDTLLLTNYDIGHLVTVTGAPSGNVVPITAASCGGVTYPLSGSYGIGTLVVRAQWARFYIDPNFDGQGPMLMMMSPDGTSEPVADGIEDMQIAIGRDNEAPADGLQETVNGTGDDWAHNAPGVVEVDAVADPLRAVRITLVARSRNKLTGTPLFYRPAAEDRPGSLAADNYRRRSLTSVFDVRNMGGSP